jgi:type IV pilus assembly protein PilC
MRLYLPQMAIGLVLLALVIWALDRYPPSRRVLDRALYSLPIVGRVRLLAGTARFSRSLSTLLANGIDLVQSLQLCEGILVRPTPSEAIARARAKVLAGHSLAMGLDGARAFEPILPRMVDVGERSGTLDEILAEVASFHEAELRTWIRRASALIEPITTVVVGGIVGFVYIAFFVAMFSAAGAVR